MTPEQRLERELALELRRINNPQPWHGSDRDRDYWEPRPWENGYDR